VTMTCLLWSAGGRSLWCHWISCHAHVIVNVIKWGSYQAHIRHIYGVKRKAAIDTGLSKPRPGDRGPREVGAIRLSAGFLFFRL
jgi:hypothetical protein